MAVLLTEPELNDSPKNALDVVNPNTSDPNVRTLLIFDIPLLPLFDNCEDAIALVVVLNVTYAVKLNAAL